MNSYLFIAIALLVLWIVLRLVVAMTGLFLHLIWIAALVMLALWVWNKIARGRGGAA